MTEQRQSPILIAAGGTGGHVYPALAIAEVLRTRNVPVVWLGTPGGLEARLVPAAGFDIEWVNVAGVRGKNLLGTLLGPVRLCRSLVQAWKIFNRCKPGAVLGMGGFVAAPGGLMAVFRRRPLIIHEQNSVAGMTNRGLSRFAQRVFTAFPNVFAKAVSAEQVGNPVRTEIVTLGLVAEERRTRLLTNGPCRLLVVGGSRGARKLNQIVPAALKLCGGDYEIWHQSGNDDHQATLDAYAGQRSDLKDVRVTPFIETIVEAYEWADVIVCRAGAMTVSELVATGLGSVLVPYPYAVDDHQTTNALWLVRADAAVIMPQSDLTAPTLAQQLDELNGDRERLAQMSENAHSLYISGAAEKVADALQEVSL